MQMNTYLSQSFKQQELKTHHQQGFTWWLDVPDLAAFQHNFWEFGVGISYEVHTNTRSAGWFPPTWQVRNPPHIKELGPSKSAQAAPSWGTPTSTELVLPPGRRSG